jgi:phospholipase C
LPPGQQISTVIILIEENHSFDSLFAEYPGANGKLAPENCPVNEKAYMANMMAPDSPYICSYHENQVPNYWKMARNFSLCDNYFSELKAPSTPNFLMLGTAQSPILLNPRGPWSCPNYCIDIDSMPKHLDDRGKTWRDYGGGMAVVQPLRGRKEIVKNDISPFFSDAAAGTLQNVIWIYTFLLGGNQTSGHPPSNICHAENYAVDIVNAVMHSPQWSSTLLFVVWDEWGAYYDHVTPPSVEVTSSGKEYRYGPRVPCIVISPYAKKGYVSHTLVSHVSLLKTIELIYNINPINERDGKANSLMDCLDFTQEPLKPIQLNKYACPG